MDVRINENWRKLLQNEFDKEYFAALVSFVKNEYATKTIYPPARLIFNAFDLCPPENVKVVILGQDPYHGVGQAHGLCFSVPDGIKPPPSLVNIFKEIQQDIGTSITTSGNLERWAQQGVLLLNATLTVRAHQAGSHQKHGWETFTDSVIQIISNHCDHVVFLLWGAYAGKKSELVDSTKHLILKSVHPSPLSAHSGFFGNHHFSLANNFFLKYGKEPIIW